MTDDDTFTNTRNLKNCLEELIKNEIEEKKYKLYFHPKISRGTEEIILAMNEAKENYLCQNTESNNSNNYYYLTDNTLNQNYLIHLLMNFLKLLQNL